jgi:hypothetical protein
VTIVPEHETQLNFPIICNPKSQHNTQVQLASDDEASYGHRWECLLILRSSIIDYDSWLCKNKLLITGFRLLPSSEYRLPNTDCAKQWKSTDYRYFRHFRHFRYLTEFVKCRIGLNAFFQIERSLVQILSKMETGFSMKNVKIIRQKSS